MVWWISLGVLMLMGADNDGAPVREVQVLGTDRGAELFSVSGLAVTTRGIVYVSDMVEYALKAYDAQGKYIGKVGRRGRGPGEFRTPSTCIVHNDTVAVLQVNNPRLQLFTSDLRYVATTQCDAGIPIDLAAGPRGELYVAVLGDRDRQILAVYPSLSGGPPRRMALEPTGKKHHLYTACKIGVFPDGAVVAAYAFLNRVDLHGSDGKLLKRWSVPSMRGPSNERDPGQIPDETYFKGVIIDHAGNVMLLGGSLAPHESRDVFVFTARGDYRESFTLPARTRLIAGDGGNHIYATADEGSVVKKYELRSPAIR